MRSASARACVIARKAGSNCSGPRAPTTCSSTPSVRAASVTILTAGSARRIRRIPEKGDPLRARDRLLEQLQLLGEDSQDGTPVTPVTFPPGRAKLAMSPSPMGSGTPHMTMGIVLVAFFAALADAVGAATITCGSSRTSSAARAGSRSNFPSA